MRKEPGVRKVGNRWQVRLRLGRGERIERTLPPGAEYKDAVAVKHQIRRAQIDIAAGRKPEILIDAALDQWLAEEVHHQKSARRTGQRVAVLREFTAGRTLADLQTVASELRQADSKPATINRYLSVLRRIANLAAGRWGWIDRAPKIEMLPENNERHVYLTPEQVRRLARECDPEVAAAIALAALTGLRRSELLGAREVRGNAIVLDARTKSGKPRVVYLSPEAARIAQRSLPLRITAQDIRREFERARRAVGLPHVQFRDLRHTFASWVIQQGHNTKMVQELLGHAQLTTTQRYAHLAAGHLRAAVNDLPAIGGARVGKRRDGSGA